MLFNSLAFAAFLPVVFGLYWWLGNWKNGMRAQNVFLILSGYFFYGWWDWRFLALLFVATAVDYAVGVAMSRYKDDQPPFWMLSISLVMNLGMLGTFKYFDFFSAGFARMVGWFGLQVEPTLLHVMLPVGISFYTFQTLSYTIDVYRGKLEATRDPIGFFAFVAFFPPLVAGPIARASHLLPQILAPRKFDYPAAVVGLRLILWGIFKKVAIADVLAPYVDFVYGGEAQVGGIDVLLATVMFAVQLYCDFSGYTDVARGCARLLGFELAPNFDRPYFAKSLQDFWARWHISLSSWFQDYLFMGLAIQFRRLRLLGVGLAVFLTFLISGLWHGAAITFVIWGGLHGLMYVLERWWQLPARLPGWLMRLFTWAVVLFGYVFFRAGKLSIARQMLQGLTQWANAPLLFQGIQADLSQVWPITLVLGYLGALAVLLFVHDALFDFADMGGRFSSMPRWGRWTYYYFLVGLLLALGAYGTPVQFIYFQF
jgi:alginate O-acetyltransferase complex protein AlgI